MLSEITAVTVGTLKRLVGQRGFFALALVVLLLFLTTMALIGPYQLALADWHVIRDIVSPAPSGQPEVDEI